MSNETPAPKPRTSWKSTETRALIDERKRRNDVNIRIEYENFINIFAFGLINSMQIICNIYRNTTTLRARRASSSGAVLRATLIKPAPVTIRALNVNENSVRSSKIIT